MVTKPALSLFLNTNTTNQVTVTLRSVLSSSFVIKVRHFIVTNFWEKQRKPSCFSLQSFYLIVLGSESYCRHHAKNRAIHVIGSRTEK